MQLVAFAHFTSLIHNSRRNPAIALAVVKSSERVTPTCSAAVSRRTFLQLVGLATTIAIAPRETEAFSLKDAEIQKTVGFVALGRTKAVELRNMVQKWTSCTDDDRLLVLRFVPIWLAPAQRAAAQLPNLLEGSSAANKVGDLTTQANAAFGHLLELKQEANSNNVDGILRELDEIVETADEILSITALVGAT